MLMLYAGLRRGEAIAIDIDRDVDFVNKRITVRGAISFVKRKPILKTTKTKAGIRTIPLLSVLQNELIGLHGVIYVSSNQKGYPTLEQWRSAWDSYVHAL